ncbi:type IV pili methyl-accepting chemotaxis transducer N-terminal domain-containing protein [Parathalassolituus penaei]|uniref:Type IV pili methyl-accepting chemotaxis transducer N-terminal domain-containing protein n=1 Tax=Parathalassolituus penaei TaxID=2997323 RepID=A0A9X3ECP1_9GAMM|nr:type IV pili methyl-accepting chemotaxis transducer N-terminal domain-containing protein [Parathalassolituus penaei]MCY0965159.1 type IV pili methyl-accepting chemotaxis transducer N-terminal domain-containing protein [Parathalassolituus penaei]
MAKQMRFGVLVWLMCLPLMVSALTDIEAVNVSGSQRMLTQRMMKDYLMIGADVKADQAKSELTASMARFDANLAALVAYSDSPDTNAGLELVASIWSGHKAHLQQDADKTTVVTLLDENLQLLAACQALVEKIENKSTQRNTEVVNLAGRQRMLSQRIAKAYMALYWQVPDPKLQAELDQAEAEFDTALTKLQAYSGNTNEINQELGRVAVHWKFARPGMDLSPDKPHAPGNIFTTMNSVMDKMNQITHLYEVAQKTPG